MRIKSSDARGAQIRDCLSSRFLRFEFCGQRRHCCRVALSAKNIEYGDGGYGEDGYAAYDAAGYYTGIVGFRWWGGSW
jgi:hypothetical protein